jgi:hypothetical protein
VPVPITAAYDICQVDDDLGPYLFLQAHEARGDVHLVRRQLGRSIPRDVLPERARLVRSIDGGHSFDLLAELDGVLVLLRSWSASADVWATAADAAAALAVVEEVRARVPARPSDRRVEVQFTDEEGGSRHLPVDARPWDEVRGLYPSAVRAALDALVAHRPAQDEARRLLLWHGPPGTGKTSAVRALLHAWRDWADGVVVTDPEALLTRGKYLRRVLLEQDDDRWQLVVLEDAEALLRKDTGGKAMARLLNLADGLLGQGLRCLFLLTTNDPLGAVHPALLRPGRCLATVEFGALSAAEAALALGRPVARPMTLAELTATRPVTTPEEPVAVGQYL